MNITHCRKSKKYKERLTFKFDQRIREIDQSLNNQIKLIKSIENEYELLLQNYHNEKKELKRKFVESYTKLFEKRQNEINKLNELKTNINFWFKVILNSKATNDIINPKDYDVLKNLINIKSEYTGIELKNFKLIFEFKPNDYFNNTVLEKEYIFTRDDLIEQIESTKIDWKQGKNYITTKIKKKVKNKITNEIKEVETIINTPSFFNFFCNIKFMNQNDIKKLTFEKEKEYIDYFDNEYNISKEIKDEIIPYACEYYVGIIQDNEIYDDYLQKNLTNI